MEEIKEREGKANEFLEKIEKEAEDIKEEFEEKTEDIKEELEERKKKVFSYLKKDKNILIWGIFIVIAWFGYYIRTRNLNLLKDGKFENNQNYCWFLFKGDWIILECF